MDVIEIASTWGVFLFIVALFVDAICLSLAKLCREITFLIKDVIRYQYNIVHNNTDELPEETNRRVQKRKRVEAEKKKEEEERKQGENTQ